MAPSPTTAADSAILVEAIDGGLISPDVAPMMRVVVERAMTSAGGDGTVLEVMGDDVLLYVAAAGAGVPWVGSRVQATNSLSGLSIRTGEVQCCDDSELDDRVDREACRRIGVRSMLCVPIRLGADTRAVLKVYSAQPNWFDEAAVERVRLLAEMTELACDAAQARTTALVVALERLEELDRMRNDFVSLLNHELRTPLASVTGYLELLADDEDLSPQQANFVQIAQRNSARLTEMVDQLLTLARLDSGKTELSIEPVNLAGIAAESLEAIRPVAEQSGVSVSLEADGAVWSVGDAKWLSQITDNLVANAVKYTPAGGSVAIRVTLGSEEHVLLRVSDTGIGIPGEELPRLFERFFRASTAVDSSIPGTGLGLAITKALIEGLGGGVAVRSEVGAGTTFDVTLPAARG
jgi:signal transduction histidine kinase